VNRAGVLSKCGWSPLEGQRFDASIASTFVNGERVWDGSCIDERVRGQRLEFAR
jgi:dihydroorotase